MTHVLPRLITGRALLGVAAASVLGLTGLVVTSTDALLDRSFARAFASASGASKAAIATSRRALEPAAGDEGFWLTRHEPQPMQNGHGFSKVGDRITMAVEGGRALEFEVISVSEFALPLAAVELGATRSRQVMVTCREVGDSDRPGRVVRLIVDADEPLQTGGQGTARAL